MNEQTKKIIEEIQQGENLSEIARKHNISRQRVHQIKNNIEKYKESEEKPTKKKPTKKELNDLLTSEMAKRSKMQEEIDKLKQREWESRLPLAFCKAMDLLKDAFGGTVRLLRFEHSDTTGYWFSFELINDSTRQTLRVGHCELSQESKKEEEVYRE